jgi:hypothetical protein
MDNVVSLVNTGIDYLKQNNPLNFISFNTIKKPIDTSGSDVAISQSGEPFDDAPPSDEEINPIVQLVIDYVLMILYYVFILMLASIVANDLIFYHWVIRLVVFCFVLVRMYESSLFIVPIAGYYTLNALYNAYVNFRDRPTEEADRVNWTPRRLLPRRYGFLPIMTSRGWRYDFLNPFSYFDHGEDPKEVKYANYKNDADEHKAYLNTLIPDFKQLEGQGSFKFKELLKRFGSYFYEINQSFYKPIDVIVKPVVIPVDKNKDRDAVEQQVLGAILKTTGPKESKDFIKKTLGATV